MALAHREMQVANVGSHPRNTTAVKRDLLGVRRGDLQSASTIGACEPATRFIEWARKPGTNAVFVNVSFVGTKALAAALSGAASSGRLTPFQPTTYQTGMTRMTVRSGAYSAGLALLLT
ncbi:MAG: hypothetical protein ACE363_03915 [Alphaproteobacteria bacterium]